MAQNLFEDREKFANLFGADDESGKETQRVIVRAVDEQPAIHGFRDERRAVDGELDADHEAFAANLLDEGIFFREFFDAGVNFGATSGGVLEDFLFFEKFQEFERDGADHGTAAERCAVYAGTDAGRDGFGRENSAEGQTGGERLGDGDEVRLPRKFLVSKIAAGAPEPALNFVGDEQSAVLRGEGAGAIPECLADGIDSAFALNGFENDGADVFVEFGFEVGNVVAFDEFDAGNERSERQAIFFGGGDADGAESTAVERIFEGEDAMFWIWGGERRIGGTRIEPGEF